MALPKITKKQQEIILLTLKFRFINRIQIQKLLNHKNKRRINSWLQDLVQKNYLQRIYSTSFGENTKPAIYYLGTNGLKCLKTEQVYSVQQIRKFYQNKDRSEGLRNKYQLIVDIYLDFEKQSTDKVNYTAITESDYTRKYSDFNFISQSNSLIHPNLLIKKVKGKQLRAWYNLEVIDETLPKYRLKKKLSNYIEFFFSNEWESHTNQPFPIILLIFSTKAEMLSAKRLTKRLLEERQSPEDLHIRFTTAEQIKKLGVTSDIWEEA